MCEVVRNKASYYAYKEVEKLRAKMLADQSQVTVEDMGAGSKRMASSTRQVSKIAKHSVKPAKYGQLLFRLIDRFESKNILELGTCLGITTCYFGLANQEGKVVSIEGAESLVEIAQKNLNRAGADNVELVVGNFDDQLPIVLEKMKQVDFCYIDGNHAEEPTLKYFEMLLPYISDSSVLVFDDIHWSEGMERAWEKIKSHPRVTVTLDFYHLGVVFFKQNQKEQHFTIKY